MTTDAVVSGRVGCRGRGGPALGVVLDEVLDDGAVDGIDEDEAAAGRRILR